jgi:hypothetical protein
LVCWFRRRAQRALLVGSKLSGAIRGILLADVCIRGILLADVCSDLL